MTIQLPDLRQAVIAYLNTKVTVDVLDFQVSNPPFLKVGEPFSFTVRVSNATTANGGIALTNVRYQVSTSNPEAVKITVPTNGSAIDRHGHPLSASDSVDFFEFNPAGEDVSYLRRDETDLLAFNARAVGAGSCSIRARILADPDINELFPRNFPSAKDSLSFSVIS